MSFSKDTQKFFVSHAEAIKVVESTHNDLSVHLTPRINNLRELVRNTLWKLFHTNPDNGFSYRNEENNLWIWALNGGTVNFVSVEETSHGMKVNVEFITVRSKMVQRQLHTSTNTNLASFDYNLLTKSDRDVAKIVKRDYRAAKYHFLKEQAENEAADLKNRISRNDAELTKMGEKLKAVEKAGDKFSRLYRANNEKS